MNEPFSLQTESFDVDWESQVPRQHGRWFRQDNGIVVLSHNPSLPSEQELGGSGSAKQGRADYTPRQVIDTRYSQAIQRHDHVLYSVHPITVKYDSNFDEFAARVAYALRDKLYYRHDGGRNARGLVRATGDLRIIHSLYRTAKPPTPNGTPIELNAIFGRRRDPRAAMRWVMVIRFNDSKGWGFVDMDPDVIVVNTADAPRKVMATVLLHASLACQDLPGFSGKRICEMVNIAERVKYPKNWGLWYYERSLVDGYVNWRTGNARRREMTRTTGGRVPFDGDSGFPQHANWRIYPFREAAIKCSKQMDFDNCKAIVLHTLVHAEDEMRRTFQDIQKMFSSDSAAVFGPLVEEFRKHLVGLLNIPDSLYSVFSKYPK